VTLIFADTSYWIAVVSPRDELHHRTARISASLTDARIVTSEWVLTELLNHFAERERHIRLGISTFVDELLKNAATLVVPIAESAFQQAFQLYKERLDKHWSLSDCASFVLMSQLGIVAALTHDRHFEQAGFHALLRG